MPYTHPDDNNLKNLHKAMQYSDSQEPELRVNIGEGIDISGTVNIPANLTIDNFPAIQPVSGTVSVDSLPEPVSIDDNGGSITVDGTIQIAPGSYNSTGNLDNSVDAFGRLRISDMYTLFDSSLRYDDNPFKWDTALSGTGAINHLLNESSMQMSTTGAGSVIRQSKTVFSYQPGKSLLSLTTFAMGTPTAGVTKRAGYYGAENGIFFELDGTNIKIVKRSSITGSVVDTGITQPFWNVDKLDGTGPSGIDLNEDRAQIFWCDIEWLGVGSVRTGFVINGQFITCHIFHHANTETGVYMTTASLPVRYELISTGAASSMKQICSSVISEGGYVNRSRTRSVSTPLTGKALSDVTYTPLVSIKLKNNRLDSVVVPSKFDLFGLQQAAYKYQLILNPTLTNPNWSSLNNLSDVDYDIDATGLTGGIIIDEGIFVGSNKGGSIAVSQTDVDFSQQLGRTIAGVSDIFCLAAIATTNNDDAVGSLTWEEHS